MELSNGLIAMNNLSDILFYIYDTKNKKLEKKDVIKTKSHISKIFKTKDGNIISCNEKEIIVYNKNKSIQIKIKLDKLYPIFEFLEGKYIIISYNNNEIGKVYIDVYDIKKWIIIQTLEVKYKLFQFIKLNDNLLIASDILGNIHELNLDNNYKLSVKDIFWAHESPISQICKFDDNKVLSISHDGKVKLWEFN